MAKKKEEKRKKSRRKTRKNLTKNAHRTMLKQKQKLFFLLVLYTKKKAKEQTFEQLYN